MSVLIAFAALVVAGTTGFIALRTSRQANSLAILVHLFEEFRNKHVEARTWLTEQSDDPHRSVSGCYNTLPESVVRLSHYLDNVGLLVYQGVVSRRVVGSFVGGASIHAWRVLKPYCIVERTT